VNGFKFLYELLGYQANVAAERDAIIPGNFQADHRRFEAGSAMRLGFGIRSCTPCVAGHSAPCHRLWPLVGATGVVIPTSSRTGP